MPSGDVRQFSGIKDRKVTGRQKRETVAKRMHREMHLFAQNRKRRAHILGIETAQRAPVILTIHGVPNLSTSMPKLSPHGTFSSGMLIVAPSLSLSQ